MLETVCERCPSKEFVRSQWLEHLLWLRTVQNGGLQLDMDDLELNTWYDLGVLDSEMNKGKMHG